MGTDFDRLGKYEILQVLGKGAMGVVYKARDPDIDRTVAIKTIRKELVEDDDRAGMVLARFKNEARAAGRLAHPGIVAVYDYGESGSVAYIAMEFVQGNSLREYFNRGARLPEADIVAILAQLLEALQHAHEQGVWHRDVKPANLIVMNNGRLKIADFGIARIDTSQLTQVGMVMGSPGYMAPEQYSGGTVDWRADLFAAGVVLHQLLTGERPFSGTTEQVAYKICHQPALPPSAADPGRGWERYDAVVARALAKDPEARYLSAIDFRQALLEAYGGPAPAAVSDATIIREMRIAGAIFEPSNPSARTSPGTPVPTAGSRPFTRPPTASGGVPGAAAASPTAAPADPGDAQAMTMTALAPQAPPPRRKAWPLALVAGAAAILGGVGVWLLRPATEPAPAAQVQALAQTAAPSPTATEPTTSAAPAAVEPAAGATPSTAPGPVIERKKAEPVKAAKTTPAPTPAPPKPEPPVARVAPPPEPPAAKAAAPPSEPPQQTGYWRDQGITLKASGKLQFNARLARANIKVETRDGVVTLSGAVANRDDIAEAARLVAEVPGVASVRNELRVGSGSFEGPAPP